MRYVIIIALILLGYLSGSVLYAELFTNIICKKSLFEVSENGNPGTANAFIYGNKVCGILAVIGDLLKGIIPVMIYVKLFGITSPAIAIIMSAPVIGHGCSCFYHMRGGMCIATSFGVFIGLLPIWEPLACLIVFFLILLMIPGIHNSIRTIITFIGTTVCILILCIFQPVKIFIFLGVFFITINVVAKMRMDLRRRGIYEKHF